MKNTISKITLFVATLLLLTNCGDRKGLHDHKNGLKSHRIAFYNVENLFDLVDDPTPGDDEFTPAGKKKWDLERYQAKLNNLSKVVRAMQFPELFGVCEVENATVLKDLAANKVLAGHNYEVVHFESPDYRGIDVALLYKKASFEVIASNQIPIHFPKAIVEDYTTRDILHVRGVFLQKDTFDIFVNHWPSRRGGLKESEPKRLFVAEQLSMTMQAIQRKYPNRSFVVMGDFNDESNNNSLLTLSKNEYLDLHNCSASLDEKGMGTYNYRGSWNMLDQILVSQKLTQAGSKIQVGEQVIFRQEWLMYNDPKHGPKPNRTYGGPNYYGGYSDHLPVYVELSYSK